MVEGARVARLGLLVCGSAVLVACNRPDIRFPQFVRDQVTTEGILAAADALFEEHIAGRPLGSHDLTVTCPLGGSVRITGTTASDRILLTYDLSDCRLEPSSVDASSSVDITLTGELTQDVVPGATASEGTATLTATNLSMRGSATYGSEEGDIDEQCDVAMSLLASEASLAGVGELCGRPVTWSAWNSLCQ